MQEGADEIPDELRSRYDAMTELHDLLLGCWHARRTRTGCKSRVTKQAERAVAQTFKAAVWMSCTKTPPLRQLDFSRTKLKAFFSGHPETRKRAEQCYDVVFEIDKDE